MNCVNCGAPNEEGAPFCGNCGAQLSPTVSDAPLRDMTPGYAQPNNTGYGYGQKATTKKEFLDFPENLKMKKEIRGAAIVCYVCAGLTLIVSILANPFGILDAVLALVLGLLIHLKQSRVAAIILLVYAVLSSLLGIILSGSFGGWLVIVAGIFAVIYTFRIEKAWQEYQGHQM